jgi:hypothetical protein
MDIASALRRKRDEIASAIDAYEARIDAARRDLAALDHAARLFGPEGARDDAAVHLASGRLAPPLTGGKRIEGEDASLVECAGVGERELTSAAANSPTPAGREIPEEFFYLDWP